MSRNEKCLVDAPGALVTYDGTGGTIFNFLELNDRVMGGKLTGTFTS